MKTGEYIGTDGHLYQVTGSISKHRIRITTKGDKELNHISPNNPDWKVAKEALEELGEERMMES